MTIPRRDLLTGTALILVGEKLARADEQSGANATTSPGSASGGGKCKHTKLLRTPFMAAFTDKFIGDSTKIKQPGCEDRWPDPPLKNPPTPSTRVWPQKGQGPNDVATDYATFVNVLHTIAYVPGGKATGPNATLAAAIVQFLSDQHWPNGTPIPHEYTQNERPIVNFVEIAVIQDRLLQAISSFDLSGGGSGGGGSNWPPH